MLKRSTETLLRMIACLLGVLFALPAAAQSVNSPYAATNSAEDLLPTLQWYAKNSLGALSPELRVRLRVEDFEEPRGIKMLPSMVHEALRSAGIWTLGPTGVPEILSPFRSVVWWPGRPAENDEFIVSPVVYDVLSVDSASPTVQDNIPRLAVKYRWKMIALSPLVAALRRAGWKPPDFDLAKEEDLKSQFGRVLAHGVVMEQGEYGYFLSISREPRYDAAQNRLQ